MEPWLVAVILKPFVFLVVFVLIVYPLRNVLSRMIPDGRIKQFLYRDRTRVTASTHDKKVAVWAVVISYALLIAFGFLVVYIGS